MGVVVDSSVWVDVERGALRAEDIVREIGNVPVFLTPTILAELQYGVERAATEGQRIRRMGAMARLRRKPCLILDPATGELWGRIAAHLDRAGRPSAHRIHDLWIAAAALQRGFAVLTRNPSDFEDVPGLQVHRI